MLPPKTRPFFQSKPNSRARCHSNISRSNLATFKKVLTKMGEDMAVLRNGMKILWSTLFLKA